jgi:hypothetical protein
LEVHIGPLIEEPGCLGGVHARAAAEADHPVWLEGLSLAGRSLCRLQGGIGFHLGKDSCLNACLGELVHDQVGESQPDDVLIGDDERFATLDGRQVVEGEFAKGDLGTTKEPHRLFSSFQTKSAKQMASGTFVSRFSRLALPFCDSGSSCSTAAPRH